MFQPDGYGMNRSEGIRFLPPRPRACVVCGRTIARPTGTRQKFCPGKCKTIGYTRTELAAAERKRKLRETL